MELKLNNKGMSLIEIIISITLISMVLIFIFSLLVNVKDINTQSELNSTYLIKKALMISDIEDDLKNSTKIVIGRCSTTDATGTTKYGTNAFHAIYDSEYGSFTGDENLYKKAGMCIQFEITRPDGTTTTAWLAIHYCTEPIKEEDKGYKISYVANDGARFTRELPDFEDYNITEDKPAGKAYLKNIPSITTGKSNATSVSSSVTTSNFVVNSTSYNEYTVNSSITLSYESADYNYAVIKIPIIGADGKDYTYLISYHINKT